eukprot:TRINITY_DN2251_c0_g2_i1.p1 TRINITY_DN2251_c0_g2~~TRINITY_DN2251_c0_g2_i1.p1  ORF type:complete len:375 (+),score=131.13 TRINITY_DN2251_c0_g2_i1:111-1235(+)
MKGKKKSKKGSHPKPAIGDTPNVADDENKGLVVINQLTLQDYARNPTVIVNPKLVGPYSNKQHILVVGDGNLSFSLDLASELGGEKIIATCYDSKEEFSEKYKAAINNPKSLFELGARVFFDVDATNLEAKPWGDSPSAFDRIIFNFPHTGVSGSGNDAVESNQQLLREFFESAKTLVKPLTGEIHITLRPTEFYNKWKIVEQAISAGLVSKKTIDFDGDLYPCYQNCRTASADLTRTAPSIDGAKTYIFQLPANAKTATKPKRVTQTTTKSTTTTTSTTTTKADADSTTTTDLETKKKSLVVIPAKRFVLEDPSKHRKRPRDELRDEIREVLKSAATPEERIREKRRMNKKKKKNKIKKLKKKQKILSKASSN